MAATLIANDSTAFIWKLRSQWKGGSRQREFAVVIQAPADVLVIKPMFHWNILDSILKIETYV